MGIALTGDGCRPRAQYRYRGQSAGPAGSAGPARPREAPADAAVPRCRREVYVWADASGVVGDRGAVRTRRPQRAGRADSTRPLAGTVSYDDLPRHGSPGSRVSRTARPSHDQGAQGQRPRFAGFSTVLAAVVVTAGIVVGLDALANLAGGSGAVPTETAAVQVRSGESLSAVASRVAPGAPNGEVVARIMELNHMSSAAVQAGRTLIAPVTVAR